MGQLLDCVGLANHVERERVLVGLVYLGLQVGVQLEQLRAVVGDLLLPLRIRRREIRIFGVLSIDLVLRIGIRNTGHGGRIAETWVPHL